MVGKSKQMCFARGNEKSSRIKAICEQKQQMKKKISTGPKVDGHEMINGLREVGNEGPRADE